MVRRMVSAAGCQIVAAAMTVVGPFACGGEASKDRAQEGGRGSQTATNDATGGSTTMTTIVSGGSGNATSKATGGATTMTTIASGGFGNATSSDGFGGGVAGSTGSSDTAGAAAVAGATGCRCDSPNCGTCPIDRSVLVDAGDRSYRIDATEVTNRDYAAFVAANPVPIGQPSLCSWNGSYVPPNAWPMVGVDDLPVVWVDWCDAYAYCKWAGKRLCGNLGGGELAYGSTRDTNASQWYRACSNNAALTFPYGSTYDPERCNGEDRVTASAGVLPVASQPGCEGGLPGLFDMSGNVWEWEDSCVNAAGATDSCHLRGGSFWSAADLMDCTTATETYTRASLNKNIGFRCCSAP